MGHNSTSFAGVYREHVTPIWRYVRTRVPSDSDAEDVTSEVFAAAIRSWGDFDPQRGAVGAWLTGIARHAVADWWRRRVREVPSDGFGQHGASAEGPEGEVVRRDSADDLRRVLWILTEREREAVALRFGTELTSEEIGAHLGISAAAARMLVYRAIGKLREVITDER
ncbi:RNA polymerase sigma factor [Hoyosella subflava]|uniref:DNA-directed RNA polymerase specialized sigma subunit n=1 Tax=Hoyosella subflava (strain DSM 45089 / JCM 17490 / NBRC 109087 / DQS3-9A1) TaxID=443218 RepID=F6EFP4_HOYSD|nr:sigma-70 family RNA polymerase sigma factor [Hoyosella subflava]AEF40973.1 DNA-directed RNA polymerase specialized sigma subunit [Hoyosella subflava DQS3-9A1]